MRLVVDNFSYRAGSTPIKFLPAISTFERTRMQNAGNNAHSGRKPRCLHIETVLGRTVRPASTDSASAKAAGPPHNEIKSLFLNIGDSTITFRNMLQDAKCADAPESSFSHNVGMTAVRKKQEAKEELNKTVIDRVLWLEQRMRAVEGDDFTRDAFAERMGLTYGAYKNALSRGGFRVVNLTLLAQSLDVSLDFICGLIDECKPLAERRPRPTLWEAEKIAR